MLNEQETEGVKHRERSQKKKKKNHGDENWKITGVISFKNIEVLFWNKGEKEKDVLDVGNYCQYVRDAEAFESHKNYCFKTICALCI